MTHILLALIVLSSLLAAQARVAKQGAHRMEIALERLQENEWKAIDPGLVLENNDRVRFRFKANFSGYLYVTNRGTSATTALLFPRQDTGADNRIVANREYLIPATEGAFRVSGAEGYDIVSWLVSPVELGRPELPQTLTLPETRLLPRCDDTIFRARGACVDTAAGPQALQSFNRDVGLVFIREKDASIIASTQPLRAPLVYEFHLAHR